MPHFPQTGQRGQLAGPESLAVESVKASALEWAEVFATCVRNQNFERGKTLFSENVHSYGTRACEASGLEELVAQQWIPTWQRTRYFRYVKETISVEVSGDGCMAVICARWCSIGVDSPGQWGIQTPYTRSGRCTFVVIKSALSEWQCIHSHFSIDPSTAIPQ